MKALAITLLTVLTLAPLSGCHRPSPYYIDHQSVGTTGEIWYWRDRDKEPLPDGECAVLFGPPHGRFDDTQGTWSLIIAVPPTQPFPAAKLYTSGAAAEAVAESHCPTH